MDSSVEEVELLKDGSWRTKKQEAVSLSSGDEEIILVVPNKQRKLEKNEIASLNDSEPDAQAIDTVEVNEPERAASRKSCDSDIIYLSDDENDNTDFTIRDNNSNNSTVAKHPGTSENSNKSGDSGSVDSANSWQSSHQKNSGSRPSVPPTSSPGRENVTSNGRTNHIEPRTIMAMGTGLAGSMPILQTNGFHPNVFRPMMDEVAKRQIAQNLASFLQNVCSKNRSNLS